MWATDDHASTQGISSARSSSGGAVWSDELIFRRLVPLLEPRVEMSSDGQTVAAVWPRRRHRQSVHELGWRGQLGVDKTVVGKRDHIAAFAGGNLGHRYEHRCDLVRGRFGWEHLIETSNSVNSGASWFAPTATVALSDTSKEGVEPQVAFSGGTQVTAVWRWKDGSSGVIQTLTSADGGDVGQRSQPRRRCPASEQAYDAHLDVSANGALMTVIWHIASTRTVQASSSRTRGDVVGDTDGSIREQWPQGTQTAPRGIDRWHQAGRGVDQP